MNYKVLYAFPLMLSFAGYAMEAQNASCQRRYATDADKLHLELRKHTDIAIDQDIALLARELAKSTGPEADKIAAQIRELASQRLEARQQIANSTSKKNERTFAIAFAYFMLTAVLTTVTNHTDYLQKLMALSKTKEFTQPHLMILLDNASLAE